MYFSLLKLSLKALKENIMRSLLTALGIIIGTAIVIIVLSVGAGIKELILRQLTSITPDLLWIEIQIPSDGTKAERDQSTGSGIAGGVQITTLKIKDLEDGKKLPNIVNGYPLVIGQEKFVFQNSEKKTTFWATSPEYFEMEDVSLQEGRFFNTRDNESLSRVVVIGSEMKKNLFGETPAVGQKIKANQQTFEVVGVLKERGMKMFMNVDDFAYIPIRTAQEKILGYDHLLAIALKMETAELIDTTIAQVQRKFRKNHNIKDPKKDDFVVRTMDESMEIVSTVTGGISILLFSIASISLLVGGVGIMNVMYVSVTERTNEIGLKKAIGASPFAIRFQFLAEAIILSIGGGIIGLLLGVGISWLVSFLANTFANMDWPFIFSVESLLLAFSLSAGLGIVFGFAPAMKAARLHPIDALRKV